MADRYLIENAQTILSGFYINSFFLGMYYFDYSIIR